MTPEEQSKENARLQREAWIKSEQIKCRNNALSLASGYECSNARQTIEQADILYEWLIKGIE